MSDQNAPARGGREVRRGGRAAIGCGDRVGNRFGAVKISRRRVEQGEAGVTHCAASRRRANRRDHQTAGFTGGKRIIIQHCKSRLATVLGK